MPNGNKELHKYANLYISNSKTVFWQDGLKMAVSEQTESLCDPVF